MNANEKYLVVGKDVSAAFTTVVSGFATKEFTLKSGVELTCVGKGIDEQIIFKSTESSPATDWHSNKRLAGPLTSFSIKEPAFWDYLQNKKILLK